jgi:pimeloyl-ACP methyl ester carboxylesterase
MRVLGHGEGPPKRVRHVYLLHNGLNETKDLLFHYRLAAWIIDGREDAVCIIRPLPGHLTRYPFDGSFSETPLDSYLRDPMELFRQFLRYMIEMQWLLSIILPRSHYAVSAGGRLLPTAATNEPVDDATDAKLVDALSDEWLAAFESSSDKADESGRNQVSKMPVSHTEMEKIVDDIRGLLGWSAAPSGRGPAAIADTATENEFAEYPYVHVVGYSMGGFMAQAGFFGWPQAISSCTNLFAGGAIRDLAPTAFAHPEEWQAVLHALRYELDGALAAQFLSMDPKEGITRIAGIEPNDFGYLKRIFYEVFLQYYRGGYSSRVAEFSRRLLFVVGGDDPIVRTENVLDASPPEGITLLQLADVSHFPSGAAWKEDAQRQVERDQRTFWLPEIGGVIARFSVRAESTLQSSLAACWNDVEAVSAEARKAGTAKPAGPRDRPVQAGDNQEGLENRVFERELDSLLEVVGSDPPGWLLISRNEIPPVFLGPEGFRFHARALHHSEELIYTYCQSLAVRATQLRDLEKRMTLLLPEQTAAWFANLNLREKLFARSETPGAAQIPTALELAEMMSYFTKCWVNTEAVRGVHATEYQGDELVKFGELGEAETRRLKTNKLSLTILPDVWIGISQSLSERMRLGGRDDRGENEGAVVDWVTRLAQDDSEATDELRSALDKNDLVVVKVSAAELNPRYRGHRLRDHTVVSRVLRHWAVAYRASTSPLDLDVPIPDTVVADPQVP